MDVTGLASYPLVLQVSLHAGPVRGLPGPPQHGIQLLMTSVEVGGHTAARAVGDDQANTTLIVCVREQAFVHMQQFPDVVERTEAVNLPGLNLLLVPTHDFGDHHLVHGVVCSRSPHCLLVHGGIPLLQGGYGDCCHCGRQIIVKLVVKGIQGCFQGWEA